MKLPSLSDVVTAAVGGVGVGTLAGAAAPSSADLGGLVQTLLLAAVGSAVTLAGKSLGVFVFSLLREYARSKLADNDPTNDVAARAILETVDRQDPDGKRPALPPPNERATLPERKDPAP